MVDTHCHLSDISYDKDLETVISTAFAEGLKFIIVPSTNPADFEKTITVAKKSDKIFAAIGVHPHDASKVNQNVIEKINDLITNPKVKAIGEIGLDYHYDFSPRMQQISAFEQQFRIAEDNKLPIIIHNRESDSDMISFLKSNITSETKGVIHCFSSDMEMLEKVLDMNFHISFTANITFAKTNLDEVVKNTPLNKLLLETDSPYMTPPPNRGKRNIPQTVRIVAEKISKIKNISIEEVIDMTTKNAMNLFKIAIFTFLFLFGASFVFAQENNTQYDDDYYEENEIYEDNDDPFSRKLGFGPLFGTNTFVNRYTTGSKSFSYQGLFAYGGLVTYKLTKNLILEGVYMHAKDDRVSSVWTDSLGNRLLDANLHTAIELNAIYMLIPNKMVNFYGSVGATYFINKLSQWGKRYVDDSKLGIGAGIGAFVNIALGSAGTFTFNAEWRINIRLDATELNYDPREHPDSEKYNLKTSYTSMSSIPRVGLIWYMPFLK